MLDLSGALACLAPSAEVRILFAPAPVLCVSLGPGTTLFAPLGEDSGTRVVGVDVVGVTAFAGCCTGVTAGVGTRTVWLACVCCGALTGACGTVTGDAPRGAILGCDVATTFGPSTTD